LRVANTRRGLAEHDGEGRAVVDDGVVAQRTDIERARAALPVMPADKHRGRDVRNGADENDAEDWSWWFLLRY